MDLMEAEDIKKRWQEYTEELYKKDLHDPYNHDGFITHREPDTVECKLKWDLGSITMNKASGVDGIPVDYSNSKRRCCESAALSMTANLENSAVSRGLEYVSFHQGNAQNSLRYASAVYEPRTSRYSSWI